MMQGQTAVSTLRSPDDYPLKTTIQSTDTLVHDAVVSALSHTHYPIVHDGAGSIQLVYALHSRLAAKLIHNKFRFPLRNRNMTLVT